MAAMGAAWRGAFLASPEQAANTINAKKAMREIGSTTFAAVGPITDLLLIAALAYISMCRCYVN
jgi:hypothetical protein